MQQNATGSVARLNETETLTPAAQVVPVSQPAHSEVQQYKGYAEREKQRIKNPHGVDSLTA